MQEKLKEKFMPFRFLVFKEFYLHQGDLFVTEYKLKFEELVFECDFQINHLSIIYIFYNSLRLEFKREMILHVMKSIEEMFLLILELGSSLRALLNRRSNFKIRKR